MPETHFQSSRTGSIWNRQKQTKNRLGVFACVTALYSKDKSGHGMFPRQRFKEVHVLTPTFLKEKLLRDVD